MHICADDESKVRHTHTLPVVSPRFSRFEKRGEGPVLLSAYNVSIVKFLGKGGMGGSTRREDDVMLDLMCEAFLCGIPFSSSGGGEGG